MSEYIPTEILPAFTRSQEGILWRSIILKMLQEQDSLFDKVRICFLAVPQCCAYFKHMEN